MRRSIRFLIVLGLVFCLANVSIAGWRGRHDLAKPHIEGKNALTITSKDNLQARYDYLASSSHDGVMGALSATNWRWLILTPGTYTDALTMDTDYVGVVALHKHRDSAVLSTTPTITATTYSLLGITCTDTGRYYSGNLCVEVAASDAPLYLKSNADYVCDGTADEGQINAAIIEATSVSPGGKVVLSSGKFYVAAPIEFYRTDATSVNNITIIGAGTSSTMITAVANADCNVMQCIVTGAQSTGWLTLAEFTIEGNYNNMASGSGLRLDEAAAAGNIMDVHIDHVMCIHCKEYGMYFKGSWGLKMNNCITEYCYGDAGLYIGYVTQCYITNHFSAYNTGLGVQMRNCQGVTLNSFYVYDIHGTYGVSNVGGNGCHLSDFNIISSSYGFIAGLHAENCRGCNFNNFTITGKTGTTTIGVYGRANGAEFSKNTFNNFTISGVSDYPLYFVGAGGYTVSPCVFKNIFYTRGTSTGNDITDNTGVHVFQNCIDMDATDIANGYSSSVMMRPDNIPLNSIKQVAAMKTDLPDAPDATSLGLAVGAGSTVVGTTTNGGSTASVSETMAFLYTIPENYKPLCDLTVRVKGQVSVARNAASILDVVVKRVVDAGLDATDLCETAAVDMKAVVAFTNEDFIISGNATDDELTAGDLLYIEMTFVTDDTGATADGYAEISSVKMLTPRQ